MQHSIEINSPINSDPVQFPLWKKCMLEFIGTSVFVYISIAGVVQATLSGGSQLDVALCFALGLTAGIYIADKSGGHLNPAVSLNLYAISNDISEYQLVLYILSQLCGGFFAGLMVLAVYWSWLNELPESKLTIGSFGTLKNENNALGAAIIDQLIGSGILFFSILFTPDSSKKPLIIGTTLGALALFQGTNGFAFNLARDFGPRLASSLAYGSDVFSAENHWFWVPAVIPFIGMAISSVLFKGYKKIIQ
jgi:MIP family channel proteins